MVLDASDQPSFSDRVIYFELMGTLNKGRLGANVISTRAKAAAVTPGSRCTKRLGEAQGDRCEEPAKAMCPPVPTNDVYAVLMLYNVDFQGSCRCRPGPRKTKPLKRWNRGIDVKAQLKKKGLSTAGRRRGRLRT